MAFIDTFLGAFIFTVAITAVLCTAVLVVLWILTNLLPTLALAGLLGSTLLPRRMK